jgi:hypothetical protein
MKVKKIDIDNDAAYRYALHAESLYQKYTQAESLSGTGSRTTAEHGIPITNYMNAQVMNSLEHLLFM